MEQEDGSALELARLAMIFEHGTDDVVALRFLAVVPRVERDPNRAIATRPEDTVDRSIRREKRRSEIWLCRGAGRVVNERLDRIDLGTDAAVVERRQVLVGQRVIAELVSIGEDSLHDLRSPGELRELPRIEEHGRVHVPI